MTKHMPMKKLSVAIATVMGLQAGMSVAHADERESLEQLKATTTNLIDLLVKEGVLPKDKADAIVKKASEDAANYVKQQKALDAIAAKPATDDAPTVVQEDKSVRVQYVPEHVKKEMRAEIEKQVMAKLNYKAGERLGLPGWLDRIEFYGDLRLRAQEDNFASNNEIPFNLNDVDQDMNLNNSTEDRKRLRVRARLGADVKVNDWLVGGLQFVTGLQTTPLTPNQTEGIAQGKYVFGLDRAFLKATPRPWLMVEGGRFANPFLSTDILFDPDLAFDGVATTFTPKLTDSLTSFTTVGAFPIEEIESSNTNKAKDKWLYSLQSGFKWQAPNKSTVKLAVAYHDYKNVEGQSNSNSLNDFDATVPAFRQRGNNTFDINDLNGGVSAPGAKTIALASKFEQINIIGQIDFLNFDPVHVTLTGDYVKNIGFDKNEIFKRTRRLYEEETDAYQVKLDVGTSAFTGARQEVINKDDWQVSLAYKRIEADSVLDGFNDSNFRLGGTDAKGWALVGNYAFDKNAWVGARYLSADTVSGLDYSVDVFLIDLNAKF